MATTYDEIMTDTGERISRKAFSLDDLAVWPDGSWATLGDVWNNEYAWKSDDFEMIDQDDAARMGDLGIYLD